MKRWIVLFTLLTLPVTAMAEVTHISNTQLQELLQKKVPLVDIRTAGEWQQTGVVDGSKLLTFFDTQGRYDAKAFLTELDKIATKGQPVILICRSGNRTGQISQFLNQQAGYTQVYNVEKGIRNWIAAGLPTVKPQ